MRGGTHQCWSFRLFRAAQVLNVKSRLNKVVLGMGDFPYVVTIVFFSDCFCPPCSFFCWTSGWQKAITHLLILGVRLGPWFSLIILVCWAAPPIRVSMVRFLPSTPKTDWWAPYSLRNWMGNDCLCFYNVDIFPFKKRQPLPLSPQNFPLHGSEVNGAPAVFHSGSSSFGVPSQTPPIAGTETILGKSLIYNFFFYCCSALDWV